MNKQSGKKIIFEMKSLGDNFYDRRYALEIFNKNVQDLSLEGFDLVIVDFSGISNVSSGFAFDFFKKFREKLGPNFLRTIRVKFDQDTDKNLVRSVVTEAITSNK